MELFTPGGHLTNEGLAALQAGTLGELARLEAAEHLSFCDTCLEKYTALLTGEALIEPPTSLREPVLKRIRHRGRKTLFSRYATVAAAAVIAVGIFSGGMLLNSTGGRGTDAAGQGHTVAQQDEEPAPGFTARLNNGINNVTGGINGFFNSLLTPAAAPIADANEPARQAEQPTTLSPYEQRQQERDEREQLFDKDNTPAE